MSRTVFERLKTEEIQLRETTTSRQHKEIQNKPNSENRHLLFGIKTKYHRLRRFLVFFFREYQEYRCLFWELVLFCNTVTCLALLTTYCSEQANHFIFMEFDDLFTHITKINGQFQ